MRFIVRPTNYASIQNRAKYYYTLLPLFSAENSPYPGATYAIYNGNHGQEITQLIFDLNSNFSFSISFWIRTTDTPTEKKAIVSSANSHLSNSFGIVLRPDGKLSVEDSRKVDAESTNPINDGNWHFVFYGTKGEKRTQTSSVLWIDGVEQTIPPTRSGISHYTGLLIGTELYGSFKFKGDLADVSWEKGIFPSDLSVVPNGPYIERVLDINLRIDREYIKPAMKPPTPPLRLKNPKITVMEEREVDGLVGNYYVGGEHSITGIVKKKRGDLITPYSNATITLTDTRDYRRHRLVYPNPDGSFTIPNLRKRGNFSVTVVDWFSSAYKVVMNVKTLDVLEIILEEDTETPSPTHKVEGNVKNHLDQPISRKVCVYSRENNAMLGSGISRASDGFYSIPFVLDSGKVYVVCLPNPDEDINAKIFDKVEPVPI